MDDLTAFVTARLSEVEATAARAMPSALTALTIRWVEASRAILADHTPFTPGIGPYKREPCCTVCGAAYDDPYLATPWPCETVRHIAAIGSDHPDYKDEWKPGQ